MAAVTTQPQAQPVFHSCQTATMIPQDPGLIRKVYSAELDDRFKWSYLMDLRVCRTGSCLVQGLCTFCAIRHFDVLVKPRRYLEVHENRVEYNDPIVHSCCGVSGFTAEDDVHVLYFDRVEEMGEAHCCTPYHLCCCVSCCGGVVGWSGCPCVGFYGRHMGGIADPAAFVQQFNQARDQWVQRQRQHAPGVPMAQAAAQAATGAVAFTDLVSSAQSTLLRSLPKF